MKKSYQPGTNQLLRRIGMSVAAATLMAGCASTPAPLEQMAISRAAVSNASNTENNELAPLQLKSAKEKMEAAEHAMVAKDYVLARQLAEEAQVDAQLAGAMARSAKAKRAADALQEDSSVLRQEIDRKSK